jgi:hypothetical protein
MTLFGPEIWLPERSRNWRHLGQMWNSNWEGPPQLGLNKQEANYGIKISTWKPPTFLCRWSKLHHSQSSAKTAMMSVYHGVCILFEWQVEEFSCAAESIEWFIEGRASFRRKIWLVVHPLPLSLPSVSSTGETQEDRKRETTGSREGGWGDGQGAESYDRKKAWSSVLVSTLLYTELAYGGGGGDDSRKAWSS